jgi:CheY-like chemotaxis protein
MATFGKRAEPKHRATPGTRRRETTEVRRGGAHAAPVSAEPVPPDPVAPTPEAGPVGPAPDAAPVPVAEAPVAPEPPAALAAQATELETPPATELETPQARELPAAAVSVSEAEPPASDPGTMRVLIVDDNEDVRGLLRIAFDRADIEVIGAASHSQEALALAQRNRPGVILLDVNLPDEGGLDLLPRLRDHCPQARVVMFSAQCSAEVIETARQRGAAGFVEKGVSMKKVMAHLEDVARAPEAQVVEPFPLRVYQ